MKTSTLFIKKISIFFFTAIFFISGCDSGSDGNDPDRDEWKLSDTGQTTSYTATWGEDTDYLINSPSFTDNSDDTVTDNNTGLIWQKEDDNNTYTWSEAGSYCETLTLGSKTDWRLPNRKELLSIANFEISSPSINTTYFPNTNSSNYWSSTIFANDGSYAWFVNFDGGYVRHYLRSNGDHVRCIRGSAALSANFNDNGDKTVTDNITGLTWQQEDNNVTYTWENALSYCENLSLAGQSDWRLPNIRELESIVDEAAYSPAIDTTYFPNTNSSYYWSSTTSAYHNNYTWGVYFNNGVVGYYNKSDSGYVRCIRGGQ